MGTGPFPIGIEEELARITAAADRTYRRLQQLGELNRQQGFLGTADMRQWQEATRRWQQFEAEAGTRATAAQAHEAAVAARTYIPPARHARMVAAAQFQVQQAEERQRAFQALTPTMPVPFTAFPRPSPPTPTPSPFVPTPAPPTFTPTSLLDQLARVQLAAGRTFTTLQDLGAKNRTQGFLGEADMKQWQQATVQWQRYSQDAEARVQRAQARFDAFEQQRSFGPMTRPETRQRERLQQRLDEAMERERTMRRLGARLPGPPTPGEDEDERGPGMFARGFAGFQHAMRQARDIALGVGVAQTITHGMHLADERAKGLVGMSMLTGQSTRTLGAQLDALREGPLRLHAADILRAQHAYGRLAGTTTGPGFENALLFGTAQGMDPARAATLGVLASRMSTSRGFDPLSTALGAFRQGTGNRPGLMSGDALTDEFVGMMQQGAAAGVRLPAAFYGSMAAMFTQQNPELMQVPGAMQQRFSNLQQGLAATPNDLVLAMKMRWVADLAAERRARGLSNKLDISGSDVKADIETTFGQEMAIQKAGFIPVVAERIMRGGREMMGEHRELDPMIYQRYVLGGKVDNLESEELRQGFRKAGAYPSATDNPNARFQQETRNAVGILQRNETPEFKDFEARRVAAEKGLELVGGGFLRVALNVQEALAKTGESFKDGLIPDVKLLGEALKNLLGETSAVIGLFQLLSAQSVTGILTGLSLIGVGAVTSESGGQAIKHISEEMTGVTSNPRLRLADPALYPLLLGH